MTEYLTDADREALRDALYNSETTSGWYGQPECDEVARLMAPAVEAIATRVAAETRESVLDEVERVCGGMVAQHSEHLPATAWAFEILQRAVHDLRGGGER